MIHKINNFTVVDTIYGKWIVSRKAQYHAETMVKTGVPVHPEETKFMVSIIDTLPEGCIVIDAGSNAGIFSVPFAIAAAKRSGKVYAFEVQKKLYQALCGTAVLNDLDNLDVYNCGLGSTETSLKIPMINYNLEWDFGTLSLADQSKIEQFDHELVSITTIDHLGLERLDFIKIDIEGMEIEALVGGKDTIQKHRPWAFIEYWLVDQNKLRAWFDGMGYTLLRLDAANVLCCPNEKLASSQLALNFPIF